MPNHQEFEDKLRVFLGKILEEFFKGKNIGLAFPDIPTEFTSTNIPGISIPELVFIKDTMFSAKGYLILHIKLSYQGYEKPILDVFGDPKLVSEFRKIARKRYKDFLKENWELLIV